MTALAPTTFEIPTLETARLILRAPKPCDFEDEAAFFQTERSHFVGGPLPRDQVWRAFAGFLGHWALRGFGFWSLEDKQTGRYMGRAGLWYPDGWPEPELGWTLMDHAEGKGLAFEATKAARRHAYAKLGWITAISLILPDNARSVALATRLGATRESSFEHPRLGTCEIWRHPSPDEVAG